MKNASLSAAVAAALTIGGGAAGASAATLDASVPSLLTNTPAESFSCGAATKSTKTGATVNSLYISTEGNDAAEVFTESSKFTLTFHAQSKAADTIVWSVADYTGAVHASGAISVPQGITTANVVCSSTRAGYYAVAAKLRNSGASQPRTGSRPGGYATFGVLPNVADYVPAFNASLDTRRFGTLGASYIEPGTGLEPLNENLGSSWVLIGRSMTTTEPKYAGQFNPYTTQFDPSIKSGTLARFIAVDGLPRWASTEPSTATSGTYPPKSYSVYQNYVAQVGLESKRLHNAYIPNQHKNYYQVTWEPNPGPSTEWKGTESQMVELYKAAYEGAHSTDPDAAIIGPAASSLPQCITWIGKIAPYGWANYTDAVSCHGYYTIGSSAMKPPETYGLQAEMRELRATMASAHVKTGAKLFITETGVSYGMGSVYSATSPTTPMLEHHAEAVVRTHLIMLGEGADTTFLFYAADYLADVGMGMFFNLSMSPAHNFASNSISPKPATMAIAAASRLVDGSRSLGALNNLPTEGYGYAFRLADNTHAMMAVWAHNSAFDASIPYAVRVDAPGTSGTTVMFDSMGNPRSVNYSNGVVNVTLSEMPIYVRSSNIAAVTSHVRVPQGYKTTF